MTLVVCWRTKTEIVCASDTRLSNGDYKVSDTAAKIFQVPFSTTLVEQSNSESRKSNHYSCGFAYAGSALAAQNTHSAASTCAQLLTTFESIDPPTLLSISQLYALMATQVCREMKFLNPNQITDFTGFIFGYCPAISQPKFFIVKATHNQIPLEFVVEEQKIHTDGIVAFGSGAAAFQEMTTKFTNERKPLSAYDVFEATLLAQQNRTVGELPQMAICGKNYFRFMSFLAPDRHDERSLTIRQYLNGIDLTEVGKISGYTIGNEARGFGMHLYQGRKALEIKDQLQDGTKVAVEVQNLASFELLVEHLENPSVVRKSADINVVYRLQAVTPAMGKWYASAKCPKCAKKTPICEDRTGGRIQEPFYGVGRVDTVCCNCKKSISVEPSSIWTSQWNIPNR